MVVRGGNGGVPLQLEFIGEGQPEGGCPLRISGALMMRSNFAVRATRAKHSRRFLS